MAQNDPANPKKPVSTAALAVLALLCIIIVGVFGSALIGALSTGSPKDLTRDAALICHKFVRDNLRAPSTADFPVSSESTVGLLPSGDYEVRSYVDSQNGFGAMIRSNYVCTVKSLPEEKWRLVDLTIK